MSAHSVLARGRAAAEALMTDTCTVTAVTGQTTDPETGVVTTTTTTVYTGKCKIQQATAMGQRVRVGEISEILSRVQVHLPVVGSEAVRQGHLVTVTASATDVALVGRVYRIHDEAAKTYATARRFGVEEET